MSMKVLCDVHISFKIVRLFRTLGVEAEHVNHILDGDASKDKDICRYADELGLVVVTKDADFAHSFFLRKTPKRLLKINLGNMTTILLERAIVVNLPTIKEHMEKGSCMLELGTDALRVVHHQ